MILIRNKECHFHIGHLFLSFLLVHFLPDSKRVSHTISRRSTYASLENRGKGTTFFSYVQEKNAKK